MKRKNRKRTGNCYFELESILLAFLSKKQTNKQQQQTDSTSLQMYLFQGLHS